jgi:hypothetical protein
MQAAASSRLMVMILDLGVTILSVDQVKPSAAPQGAPV